MRELELLIAQQSPWVLIALTSATATSLVLTILLCCCCGGPSGARREDIEVLPDMTIEQAPGYESTYANNPQTARNDYYNTGGGHDARRGHDDTQKTIAPEIRTASDPKHKKNKNKRRRRSTPPRSVAPQQSEFQDYRGTSAVAGGESGYEPVGPSNYTNFGSTTNYGQSENQRYPRGYTERGYTERANYTELQGNTTLQDEYDNRGHSRQKPQNSRKPVPSNKGHHKSPTDESVPRNRASQQPSRGDLNRTAVVQHTPDALAAVAAIAKQPAKSVPESQMKSARDAAYRTMFNVKSDVFVLKAKESLKRNPT